MDFEKVLELLKALMREGVDYVLVGGVALNLHGIVRATEDVVLFIRPTGDNVETQTVLVESVPVRVATPSTLYRMKKDTVRPIDRADAAALREKFSIADD